MSDKIGADNNTVLVLDGGFSTQLSKYVGDKVDGDPLWTARFLKTDPDAVVKTHLDFLRAGSDAIETNTYQASIGGFMKYLNLTVEEAYDLILYAVGLAVKARDQFMRENKNKTKPLIVGSVGPYGAHLHDGSEYSGNYADSTSQEKMKDWHRPRVRALLAGGVDILAFETIPCQKEAIALMELLKEFPNTKAWLSFSCKDDTSLSHGENFQTVAKLCWKSNRAQLLAVGTNCCSPLWIKNLMKGINDSTEELIPLVVYPNSGEKYTSEVGWTAEKDVPPLDSFVEEWLDLGIKYIGGCCRTGAEDIARIRTKVIDRLSRH